MNTGRIKEMIKLMWVFAVQLHELESMLFLQGLVSIGGLGHGRIASPLTVNLTSPDSKWGDFHAPNCLSYGGEYR
ncbi:hypothetical protein VNO78_07557 [Psophocarpus tetragonolobus]|uniref:Uncharacterized protein n=1 Tax=Psophocarpus tetragonolobus TaxID=3891 RepID=A0AAN9SUF1_PSOTE